MLKSMGNMCKWAFNHPITAIFIISVLYLAFQVSAVISVFGFEEIIDAATRIQVQITERY